MDRHARRLIRRNAVGLFRAVVLAVVLAVVVIVVPGCGDETVTTSPPVETVASTMPLTPDAIAERVGLPASVVRRAVRASPLPPPPADSTNRVADDPDAVALGRRLFFDPAISGNGEVSCATCHQPALRFTDGLARSRGIGLADRHSPTLVDAAHHRWFNWDGRSDSMWGHSIRPIEHPAEMGGDRSALARLVLSDDEYRASYETVFGPAELDPASLPAEARPDGTETAEAAWAGLPQGTRDRVDRVAANLGKALAAYQRTLAGGETRFDRWVAEVEAGGDGTETLTDRERRGLALFFGRAECWECHAGPLFSDGEFHNIGIPAPDGLPRDQGRYAGAGLVRDDPFNAAGPHSDDPDGARGVVSRGVKSDPGQWGAFRTPMLRGVGLTPPYMHDGSMPDLETVVRFYSTLEGAVQLDHHQESVLAPLGLEESEIDAVVAFLRTLDGRLPGLGHGS